MKITSARVYVNGVKQGRTKNLDMELMTNDESQTGLDGYIGHTVGVRLTKGTLDMVVAEDGKGTDLTDKCLNAEEVSLVYTHGNRLMKISGRITGISASSDAVKGSQEAKYSWEGGGPTIFG